MRWVPGSDPEPLPWGLRQLDPYTGVVLARDGRAEPLLVRPDGATLRLGPDPTVMLAPGARRLYTFREDPPRLLVSDVDSPAATPREYPLPAGARIADAPWGRPVWEDPDRLLILVDAVRAGMPAIRLDVRTGAAEAVPLTVAGATLFVEPLPAPHP
jgi:hypothetical protein